MVEKISEIESVTSADLLLLAFVLSTYFLQSEESVIISEILSFYFTNNSRNRHTKTLLIEKVIQKI